MTQEERRRMQREIQDAFVHLNNRSQEKLLRLAQHLAEHKLFSQLYMGDDDPEPCCHCTHLN